VKTQKSLSSLKFFSSSFAPALTATLALAAILSSAASASVSEDYCEEDLQSQTQTGVLTRRSIKAHAELDFAESRDGVLALSATSVKAEGIPQIPSSMKYTVKDFSMHLVRERDLSTGVGNPGDASVRVYRLFISSQAGSATFQLVGGTLLEKPIHISFENEQLLEGRDPQQLPLSETLRLLGFRGEVRQAALQVVHSECALSQDASGTRLLQRIIRKFDKPAPHRVPWLGCPPCELE